MEMRSLGWKGVNPDINFFYVYMINITAQLPLSTLSDKEMGVTEKNLKIRGQQLETSINI